MFAYHFNCAYFNNTLNINKIFSRGGTWYSPRLTCLILNRHSLFAYSLRSISVHYWTRNTRRLINIWCSVATRYLSEKPRRRYNTQREPLRDLTNPFYRFSHVNYSITVVGCVWIDQNFSGDFMVEWTGTWFAVYVYRCFITNFLVFRDLNTSIPNLRSLILSWNRTSA